MKSLKLDKILEKPNFLPIKPSLDRFNHEPSAFLMSPTRIAPNKVFPQFSPETSSTEDLFNYNQGAPKMKTSIDGSVFPL